MLLTTPKIQRLNYQLVRVIIALKYKYKKGKEHIKGYVLLELLAFSIAQHNLLRL